MPLSAPRPELTPAALGAEQAEHADHAEHAEGAEAGRARGAGFATEMHIVRDTGVRVEEDAHNEPILLQGRSFVFSIEGLNSKSFCAPGSSP